MLGFGTASGAFLLRSQHGFMGSSVTCAQPSISVRQGTSSKFCKRLVVHCGRRGGSGGRERRGGGDGRRPNRVGELIRREICSIIDDAFARTYWNDDQSSPVLISVVDVKCSDDLKNARISVSVLGSDEQKTTAMNWLRSARKELRFELAKCVSLKYIPEISFTESEMAQAVKTVGILNMLAREREEKQLSKQATGTASLETEPDLDLDSSADDALILDDLDQHMDGIIDAEDEAEDALIIEVTGEDEDFEVMSDDRVRRALFNTLGKEDFAR